MKRVAILVVDDSAFSRRTITRMLEDISCVDVVGYAVNGEEGIQKVITLKPDLVTLDLEMPKMDGFTLLRIITTRFSLPVIVISALSGADKVFRALELGALDFVAKPTSDASVNLLSIRDDLQKKVLHIVSLKSRGISGAGTADIIQEPLHVPPSLHSGRFDAGARKPIDIFAIGASTGGPPALQQIFSAFSQKYPFAVVVSQHMPAGFTKAFAERLDRNSPFDIKEAEDGDPVLPGAVLIAPGGKNLVFEEYHGKITARVIIPSDTDRCVPSVDVMLESCSAIYKERVAAVILTGMGSDGSRGVRAIKAHGGYVFAESEETAVVFGMPREAVATGVVDRIVPLHNISQEIVAKGGFR